MVKIPVFRSAGFSGIGLGAIRKRSSIFARERKEKSGYNPGKRFETTDARM